VTKQPSLTCAERIAVAIVRCRLAGVHPSWIETYHDCPDESLLQIADNAEKGDDSWNDYSKPCPHYTSADNWNRGPAPWKKK
jgi:hypothetical protein